MTPRLLFLSLLFGSMGMAQLQAQEPLPATILESTDAAGIDAALGKVATVHATVERIEVQKTEHRKIILKGTKFCLYIFAKDYAASPNWNLDAWVGKEIFATGLIKPYYSNKEIVLKSPSQIGATAAELKLPVGESQAATPAGTMPAGGDFEVKLPKAELTQMVIQIKGSWMTRVSSLASEKIEIAWNQGKTNSSGKALIFGSYNSKGREAGDAAVSIVAARHGGEWPAGKSVQVIRPATTDGSAWPTTLTMAVLLESSIQGWKIPPGTKIMGELSANGMIEGGHNELYRTLQLPPAGDGIVLVPASTWSTFEDVILQGSLAPLANTRFFSIGSLDDVGTILTALEHNTWDAQFKMLSNLQSTLATKGQIALRSPEARAGLIEMARFCPSLINIRALAKVADGKPATVYSINGAAQRLFAIHAQYLAARELLQNTTPEARKKAKELKDALATMKPLIPPKYKVIVEKLDALFDAVQDAVRYEAKDDSPRATKSRSTLKSAASSAATEVAIVEPEVGLAHQAK
jgi:hypothetical protein